MPRFPGFHSLKAADTAEVTDGLSGEGSGVAYTAEQHSGWDTVAPLAFLFLGKECVVMWLRTKFLKSG